MKSRGEKRKINNAPAQGFPSALPGAMGDHAPPRGSLLGGSLARGEARPHPPSGGLLLSSIFLCPPPRGEPLKGTGSPAKGATREVGVLIPVWVPAVWLWVGFSSPPLLLSPLGAGVDGLAWKPSALVLGVSVV